MTPKTNTSVAVSRKKSSEYTPLRRTSTKCRRATNVSKRTPNSTQNTLLESNQMPAATGAGARRGRELLTNSYVKRKRTTRLSTI